MPTSIPQALRHSFRGLLGETAQAGVKPVAVRKHAATDYGGLGDHELFEVDYEVTCH